MRILIINNHDSFVFNIVELLREISRDRDFRNLQWDMEMNDEIDIPGALTYDALILSPGPGIPEEAGQLMELMEKCANHLPILGICLGFQAIGEYFGAKLHKLPTPKHGHRSILRNIDPHDAVMGSLADRKVAVGRYHSWVIDRDTLPAELIATSFDEEGNIMSLRHKTLPVFGTQFHPESIITDCGQQILSAFLHQYIQT